MEKKKNTGQPLKNINVIEDKDNISTIREILFGNKIADFERRFEVLEKRLDQEIASVREEMERQYQDIRQLLLDQHKKLSDDLQRLKKELHSSLETKTAALEDKKVNRFDLASLLGEIALQLSKESPETGDDTK